MEVREVHRVIALMARTMGVFNAKYCNTLAKVAVLTRLLLAVRSARVNTDYELLQVPKCVYCLLEFCAQLAS